MSAGDSAEGAMRWRTLISRINVWKQGELRAVHKPLLTLMVLARAQQGGPDRFSYAEDIDGPLRELLVEFGPERKRQQPEFPFWHLQHDGFWVVENAASLPKRVGKDQPSRPALREHNASAHVPEDLWGVLTRNPSLTSELAGRILEEFWPPGLHQAIRQATGILPLGTIPFPPSLLAFQERVLSIYEHRCAVCGNAGRLGEGGFALEAAHIQRREFGGPDTEDNGLALCVVHHAAFLRGAIGMDESLRICVSSHLEGEDTATQELLAFQGHPVATPADPTERPKADHIRWHLGQVFRGPPRATA